MGRLNLFAKGNVDVHDVLHSCSINGALRWNGINDVLRERHPGTLIRVRHETWTRSDALLAAPGRPPDSLPARDLPLGAHPLAAQFSTALFDAAPEAFVLSIQPDVATSLRRHRRDGFLLYPAGCETWPPEDRAWLRAEFEPVEPLTAEASMRNLSAIVDRIRRRSDAPILVFNLSPVVPGEAIHCFQGMGETFSTRVRRFNLALTELSEQTGASIVDVDALLARAGADALKIDAMHLSPAGCRLVAGEVARVLADLGLLTAAPELSCAPA